jgi:PIN domain nuclease of toxin-antitoxin system
VGRSVLILLDTHVVVWLLSGDSRLSSRAQAAIHEARQSVRGLAISDFTLFELSLLFRKKQFSLTIDPEAFLSEVESRFVVLPVTANIALQAFELPSSYPNDPVDRIIGATALVEDLPLLTADAAIRKSRAVSTIW